jgi:LysR family nitrogen assimilation transcriptional regulator
MDLRQLEYFVQIATMRGFNRAAAQMYIAQSALSRQIQQLEDELGVALLVRHRRGVELTRAGEMLLKRVETLLPEFRKIRDTLRAEATIPGGELAIGLPPSLRGLISVPLHAELRSAHPSVFMTTWVATSMALRDLILTSAVDIAVVAALKQDIALEMAPLLRDDMMLVGAKDAALPTAAMVDIHAVADLPLILTSRPNSVRLLAEEAAARNSVALQVIMEVNDVPLLTDLVREGIGYTLLPYSGVHEFLGAGLLRAVPVKDLTCEWFVISSKERPLSAAGRYVAQLLHDLVKRRVETEKWPHAHLPG